MSKVEADAFAQALNSTKKFENGLAALLTELKSSAEKQAAAHDEIKQLNARVATLENSIALPSIAETRTNADATRIVSTQMTAITSKCNNTENKLRRFKQVFFGLYGDPKEEWVASEQHVITFCSDKLGVTLYSSTI